MTKRLFIEPPMTEAEAAVRVTPGERAAAQEFLRERRRREFLTWRAVVRRELGDDVPIAYDETGAPVVPGREVHIGVSHCPGRVAVCISGAPCAVDVEPESRDFSRAAPRYMSLAERALSDDPLLPAAVWCAKGGRGWICSTTCMSRRSISKPESSWGVSRTGSRCGFRLSAPTGLSSYIFCSFGACTR